MRIEANEILDIADFFAALGHPLRLEIVRLLMVRPMCVCRLSAALDVPQPTVSRNLSILRKAGLVRRRQCGQFVRYELTDEFMGEPLSCLFGLVERWVPDLYDHDLVEKRLAEQGVTPPPERAPC